MSSVYESLWECLSDLPLKKKMNNKYIKLEQWPNFGFSKYKKEFITLSALLSKHTMNVTDLKKHTGFDENLINHFLNSAYLLQLINVIEQRTEPNEISRNQFNIFTYKLKKLLGFTK